jgi:hypothetical protein
MRLDVLDQNSTRREAGWQWPRHGFGRPGKGPGIDQLTAGVPAYWWFDWTLDCRDQRQVPMVWADPPNEWPCNDGRPLLAFNEPELAEQANLTPEQVADRLHIIAQNWLGEIYGCGTLVDHVDYVDAVVASYTARYGPWPAAGWHVHVYNDNGHGAWDSYKPSYVPGALADLDRFIAHWQERGLLGRGVVISEYGALGQRSTTDLAALQETFLAYEQGFSARTAVLSWAWFSTHYDQMNGPDLVENDGRLTNVGFAWNTISKKGEETMSFDIYDRTGTKRDLVWLQATYGNVQFLDAGAAPKFKLLRVDETEGPAVIKVRVINEQGKPHAGQPVANAWPDPSLPDLRNKGLKSVWREHAMYQNTDSDGFTGFGIGTGSYIKDLAVGGPHTIWVLSPSLPSDGISGIGMLGGTEHRGPLFLTFGIVTQESGGGGETPGGGTTPEALAEVIAKLNALQADLTKLMQHLGAD